MLRKEKKIIWIKDKMLNFLFFPSLHWNMGGAMRVGEGDSSKRGNSNMLQGAAFEIFQRVFPKLQGFK